MTDTDFGLDRIEQVALPVFDLDRAGVRLLLSRPEGVETRPGSVIYFKVADIHQAYAALQARGVTFLDSPHLIADMGSYELWMAFFKDSEENVLAISGDVAK